MPKISVAECPTTVGKMKYNNGKNEHHSCKQFINIFDHYDLVSVINSSVREGGIHVIYCWLKISPTAQPGKAHAIIKQKTKLKAAIINAMPNQANEMQPK